MIRRWVLEAQKRYGGNGVVFGPGSFSERVGFWQEKSNSC